MDRLPKDVTGETTEQLQKRSLDGCLRKLAAAGDMRAKDIAELATLRQKLLGPLQEANDPPTCWIHSQMRWRTASIKTCSCCETGSGPVHPCYESSPTRSTLTTSPCATCAVAPCLGCNASLFRRVRTSRYWSAVLVICFGHCSSIQFDSRCTIPCRCVRRDSSDCSHRRAILISCRDTVARTRATLQFAHFGRPFEAKKRRRSLLSDPCAASARINLAH